MADLRCPMCGKPNPNTNEECQHCGARLKPLLARLPAEAPRSAPARPSTKRVPEDDLPDWLARIREEQTKEEGDLPAPLPMGEAVESRRPASDDDLDSSAITRRIRGEGRLSGAAVPPDASAFEEEELTGEEAPTPDWLARLRPVAGEGELPAEETPIAAVPAASSEPDWLSRLQTRKTTEPPAPALHVEEEEARGGESESDWLDRIRYRATSELKLPADLEPPEKEEDWLARIRPMTLPERPATASPPAQVEEEDTEEEDWLGRLREHKGIELPPAPPPPPAVAGPETRRRVESLLRGKEPEPEPEPPPAIPDWLATIRAKEVPVVQEPEPEPPPAPPDWLSAARSAEPSGISSAIPATASAELPDWLAPTSADSDWLVATRMPDAPKRPDLDQFGEAPSQPLHPPQREPLPESDWLSGMGEGLTLPPAQMPTERGEELPQSDLPDWLRAMRPEGAEEVPSPRTPSVSLPSRTSSRRLPAEKPAPPPSRPAPGQSPEADATPARPGTIPVWLAAMRPLELSRPAAGEELTEEYVEAAGPLTGMRGLLRAEPIVALPRKPEPARNRLEVSDIHTAQAEVLRGLLEEEERQTPARSRARLSLPIERWVVALILVAAVLAPIILKTTALPKPETIAPETLAAGTLINDLPPDRPVLVAFEYEPASAGELDASARAVVDHLMAKGLRIATLSTHPSGAGLAWRLMEERALAYNYQYGKNYVNLGFLPGEGVGLRALAVDVPGALPADFTGASPWGQAAVANVKTLADFELVVVISATPDGVRQWMEQVQPLSGSPPFVAVISAGAEPLVRPYYESEKPQLAGLITGFLGSGGYEQLNGRPGLALARWDSYGYGLIASSALLVGGALIFGMIGLLRRDESGSLDHAKRAGAG